MLRRRYAALCDPGKKKYSMLCNPKRNVRVIVIKGKKNSSCVTQGKKCMRARVSCPDSFIGVAVYGFRSVMDASARKRVKRCVM
jgi:hypothetical protein